VDVSARQIYMAGSGGFDGVVGVLSSGPASFLANADSWAYLSTVTRDTAAAYTAAQAEVQAAQQDVDAALAALVQASAALAVLQQQYGDAMAGVQDDTAELAEFVAASQPEIQIGTDGCPTTSVGGVVPDGLDLHALCVHAVQAAPTEPAALAIQWALSHLGAPYACGGIGRLEPFRFDCSSYVSRSYYEGAGLHTASQSWAPSTRSMVPWDGLSLDEHYVPIDNDQIRPGDLVLYNTCPQDGSSCSYRHVVMYLGHPVRGGPAYMAHTNQCGGVSHVELFTGLNDPNFLGVRRVLPAPGELAPKG
jgi:cell wall-associated NlpC family hydrolase